MLGSYAVPVTKRTIEEPIAEPWDSRVVLEPQRVSAVGAFLFEGHWAPVFAVGTAMLRDDNVYPDFAIAWTAAIISLSA
jgi:hypothetical protein